MAERQELRPIDLLEMSPVIAAVKDEKGLKRCLASDCQIIFILYGDICTIGGIVDTVKAGGRYAIIHADMIQGLAPRGVSIDFLKAHTKADGIISTKPVLVRRALELGMLGILRAFMIDSMALEGAVRLLDTFQPDMIEVLPGVMPKIVRALRRQTAIPIISGGLISEKKEVLELFEAGADAVSTTREELWFI